MLEQLLKTQKSVSDCIAKHGTGKTNIVVTFITKPTVDVETVLCPFSSLGKSVLILKIFNKKMPQKLTVSPLFLKYYNILNEYLICDVIFPFSAIWKKHLIDIL